MSNSVFVSVSADVRFIVEMPLTNECRMTAEALTRIRRELDKVGLTTDVVQAGITWAVDGDGQPVDIPGMTSSMKEGN